MLKVRQISCAGEVAQTSFFEISAGHSVLSLKLILLLSNGWPPET